MEFIATIDSCRSALPTNIDQAVAMEIKESCLVPDVFRIIDDYPNIKHVKVTGQNYTSQEIKQMGIGEMLGNGIGRGPLVATEDTPDPVPGMVIGVDPAPSPTAVGYWNVEPYQAIAGLAAVAPPPFPPVRGIYEQFQSLTTISAPIDMDQLMRQMYDLQRERSQLEAARNGQDTILGTTADMVWYDELVTPIDGYTTGPAW